ncbi:MULTISPECIES: endonuclease [Saccharopolyspora]|uniref:Endonuclease n=1 Tax=Saccharopolyspora gregorii TaxID=33914 RepID=A0ABP6RZF4_9PSEU|nr:MULTISPECIES: endonuclease [unclassified Saccharopolyspora]MCA1187821.1 endonuclease [Saccharopolyspora sp. 6T]MCA1193817.1 endonuclease [Saccharopolyspora sp. 6V]MCA1227024.1 endonuclease [Saccharopolyspora sp. 6M]MCA1282976.1 endonuclease [Saccharopolyspora sp. 7B]
MSERSTARALVREAGTTYAEQAGIALADKPSPLYRLLVLSVLLSTRIKAEIAVAAARELGEFPTAERMRDSTWQQRVDALGRGHYVRYDESTATALGRGAELVLDRYRGDLRRLRAAADGDPAEVQRLLREVPSLGPVGAHIFCREAQAVWPELRPHFDAKALSGAEKAGLPADAHRLGELVPADDHARFSAALVRITLEKGLLQEITASA